MLETKCVGDSFKMLVTGFGHFGLYFLTLPWTPTSKRCHQDLNSVDNILNLPPTVSHQHHNVTNMTITDGIYCLHTCSMRKIRFIIYLSYFVQPFRNGILLFVWISHFDPQSRSVFDENISFPLQLDGSISIDKLKLQSETSPDSHWSPIELGRQILNLQLNSSIF